MIRKYAINDILARQFREYAYGLVKDVMQYMKRIKGYDVGCVAQLMRAQDYYEIGGGEGLLSQLVDGELKVFLPAEAD